MTRALPLTLAAAAAALLGVTDGAARQSQATRLVATVGPEFTIVIRDGQGNAFTRLEPGAYEIEVRDLSDAHNFRLQGPGVNRATSIEGRGTERWSITLADGRYTFVCDPHPGEMRGSFVVGNPPAAPAPPAAPPQSAPVTPRTRLVLTSGPGFSIALRTAAGRAVRAMRVGTYTVVIRDRSRTHNARIVAPGFRRATTVPFVGQQRWRVRLARAGALRFLCDPHASTGMRGSARIVR